MSTQKRRKNLQRRIQLERLESRHLMTAAPLGATPRDTAEYLLGTVAVTTVLFESNGAQDTNSQDWTAQEIQQTIDKVVEGVTWWSDLLDTLGTVHSLDFVFDHSFAQNPFETSFEPIDRKSQDHTFYVAEFLTDQGLANEPSIESAIWRFNHDQRERLNADWSFTVFVVDSSDDPNGLFAPGGFPAAFALPGGLYMVVPSERSASTIAHEMGHIFWAFDEYPGGASYNARRGYYDTQNLNATDDNPDLSTQQPSIMLGGAPLAEAFNGLTSAPSTLEQVGWRDSDGDGVFDVLDVPLALDAVGHFDSGSSQYRFTGTASAVPLPNLNSYGEHPSVIGTNSAITLNRISHLQYSLDNGPWITAASPDQQEVDFDLTVNIDTAFENIRWRAIDQSTGIVSEIVQGTATRPAIPVSSHTGFAFLDENNDGARAAGEAVLPETSITIRRSDDGTLLGGVIDAADFDGELPQLDSVRLTVGGVDSQLGPQYDPDLRSLVSSAAGNRRVFHAQELVDDGFGGLKEGAVRDRWEDRKFVAEFDQPVGEVRLDVIGLNDQTYGRLEAYDALGNLITRVTENVGRGEVVTLTVEDPNASIASIRAFGLANTNTGIAVSRVEYGFTLNAVTDQSGAWTLPNLPDGDYVAELTPRRLIHQFDQASIHFQVSGGTSNLVMASAQRVDSPRHNTLVAEDANQDGTITALDALVIINDLTRNNARILAANETTGFDIDVNNDGAATALDALLVINRISRDAAAAEGEQLGQDEVSGGTNGLLAATDQVMADWPIATIDTSPTPAENNFQPPPVQSLLDPAGRTNLINDTAQADSRRPGEALLESENTAKTQYFAASKSNNGTFPVQADGQDNPTLEDSSVNNRVIQSKISEPLTHSVV
ncbi:MAG: dockerin type I domain-containing protein [Pirellulales bacterium]|nr:dockerin type I domain-containing protein [Pirellulales bacterium]